MTAPIFILGPQSPKANLPAAIQRHAPQGSLALISAGWRHGEHEFGALKRDLNRDINLLPLYGWFDKLGAVEPNLSQRTKQRQREIKSYKIAYRQQLHSALSLWTRMQELAEDNPEVYKLDVADALKMVQQIDNRAIERLNGIRSEYEDLTSPWSHPSVVSMYTRIKNTLNSSSALLIAGGHVALLRNRLYFFGLHHLIQEFLAAGKPVFAWSAGAMAITNRIILYYDDPPFGKGIPEVLDTGIGNVPQLIFLPHAKGRLRLGNQHRVRQFAQRFTPDVCLTLESGALLSWKDNFMRNMGPPESSMRLDKDGSLKEWEVSRCVL